jgi:hypothetical protein
VHPVAPCAAMFRPFIVTLNFNFMTTLQLAQISSLIMQSIMCMRGPKLQEGFAPATLLRGCGPDCTASLTKLALLSPGPMPL